jgi:hypothetical protein
MEKDMAIQKRCGRIRKKKNKKNSTYLRFFPPQNSEYG